jgi:protein SCO1
MNKFWSFGIAAVIGLAFTLSAGWYYFNSSYTYQGLVIDPPAPAADFNLTDQNGQPFRLSDQRGKVSLLFFGYTNCPDICPVTMSQFTQVKRMLGSQADKVNFVFITVDPQRDNAGRVQQFIKNFDPAFIGLTGSLETLMEVWKNYGVYQEKQGNSDAEYLEAHSNGVYVIDALGRWRMNFSYGTPSESMAQDLLHLVKEQ